MRFAVQDAAPNEDLKAFEKTLVEAFTSHGHTLVDASERDVNLAFHAIDRQEPRPYPRRHRAVFSVGIIRSRARAGADLLREAYPYLVRTISNTLVVLPDDHPDDPWVVTPELGCYRARSEGQEDPALALYESLLPLATSHLVIDNIFVPDLDPALWPGTPQTEELTWASRVVDGWGLLPSPFPMKEFLSPSELRQLRHLYGIGGLSYGNFSVRHDAETFWMSASGVNKGNLTTVGHDILLVKGYDASKDAMVLSTRTDVEPHRVSVDAVEHWMIYRNFPEVQAMMHLHGWVDGVRSTSVNYPCGTREVGEEMVALLAADPEPGRTIVGLKNHGITATGPTFHDIIARLEGHIRTQVPMSGASA